MRKMFEFVQKEADKDMFQEEPQKEQPVEHKEEPVEVNFRELAEKAIVVKHLRRKDGLTEQEQKFIADLEAIELTDEQREKVRQEIDLVLKESSKEKEIKDEG